MNARSKELPIPKMECLEERERERERERMNEKKILLWERKIYIERERERELLGTRMRKCGTLCYLFCM